MSSTDPTTAEAHTRDDPTEWVALTRTLAGDGGGDAPVAVVAPGTRFGRYRILTPLGAGGMGVVYLAEQTEPVQRQVAIKVMSVGRFSPEHRMRFAIEGQALARMSHPGIAQIHDAGATPEGHLYFVMEHVEGSSLDDWRQRRRPTLVHRVALLRDTCRAVAHAHGKGVLHCDLKPSNLLVAEIDGRPFPKLIDFGIARMAGDARHDVAGTPGYMSPEQSAGNGIDTRSDVFSLGALLYECIVPERFRPWTDVGIAIDEARTRIATEAAPAPQSARHGHLGRERGRELDAIVQRALARDRDRRYATADALADDLSRWLAREPVQAIDGGDLYRLRCLVRRQPALSASVAVFALVCALLLWRLVAQLEETRRERDTSNQVTELMLDTFRAADPYRHPGGSITARELLRQSAERLRDAPLEQGVRRRVLETLGEVQSRLELFADSAQTYAVAGQLAGDERERMQLRVAQAQSLMNAEDFAAATALVDEALSAFRARGEASVLIDALLVRAEIAEYGEDLERAHALLGEVEPLLATIDDAELRHRLQRQRGRVVLASGDAKAAVLHLSAALDGARTHFGEQDLRTLDTLSDLAVARAQAGDLERSEHERRAIVTLTELIWGEDSPGLATALSNLGAILQRRGGEARLRESVELGRRAHAILQRALGDASMETALAANNLANGLGLVGEHAAAEPLHAAAVLGLDASLGSEHSHLGIALNNQARNLLRLGRVAPAEAVVERAGSILAASIGRDHPRYALWRLTRAEWLLAAGRHGEAANEVTAARARIEADFAPESPEVARLRALQAATVDG